MNSEFLAIVPAALFAAIVSWFMYRRYGGLSRGANRLAWLGTLVVIAWVDGPRIRAANDLPTRLLISAALNIFCIAAFCWLAGPFIVRLWGKWFDQQTTEAERAPGSASWRAWFAGRHVVYALALAALAERAWDISFVLGILIFGGSLAIYPAILAVSSAPDAEVPPPSRPISADREKVLDLLSTGKITAEESAELLNALGATASMESSRLTPLSSPQRLALIGAALVLAAFFLPWFVIDVGRDIERTFSQFSLSVDQIQGDLPGIHAINNNPFPGVPQAIQNGMIAHISGGDIRHGLGWVILFLGLAAAAIPYVARSLDEATIHAVRLGALAVGSFILVYLLSENVRSVSFGIAIAMVGYALEWIGVLRQVRPLRLGVQASV